MSEVQVITDAVYTEAKKWSALSGDVEPIKQAASALTLGAAAFFVIGDVSFALQSNAYNDFQRFMVSALGGAVTEFTQVGEALTRIAKEYDKSDEIASLDLNKIWVDTP